jgi:hypothetical protein
MSIYQTSKEIRDLNKSIAEDRQMTYTAWGNGRLLANSFHLYYLDSDIQSVLSDPRVKANFPSYREAMNALNHASNGVVALGSTEKTVYTLIRKTDLTRYVAVTGANTK